MPRMLAWARRVKNRERLGVRRRPWRASRRIGEVRSWALLRNRCNLVASDGRGRTSARVACSQAEPAWRSRYFVEARIEPNAAGCVGRRGSASAWDLVFERGDGGRRGGGHTYQ